MFRRNSYFGSTMITVRRAVSSRTWRQFALGPVTRPLMLAACAGVIGTGCSSSSTEPTPVDPSSLSVSLSVTQAAPSIGARVQVSVQVSRGANVLPVGSYALVLHYDTLQLAYAGQRQVGTGLVYARASHDSVLAAGAAPAGFDGTQLVTVEFDVRKADALKSLSFDISEMTDVQFADQRAHTVIDRTLHNAGAP